MLTISNFSAGMWSSHGDSWRQVRAVGGDWRSAAAESLGRAALLLLQQPQRAVGVVAGESLHEGDGWLRLPRLQLGTSIIVSGETVLYMYM